MKRKVVFSVLVVFLGALIAIVSREKILHDGGSEESFFAKGAKAIGTEEKINLNKYQDGVIGNFNDVVDISKGYHHTAMITENGQIYIFGRNNYGQLGNGDSNVVTSNVPILLSDNTAAGFKNDGLGENKIVAVASGGYHSIMLTAGGKVYTFGRNDQGQLGNGESGTGKNSFIPILVSDNTAAGFKNDGIGDNKVTKIAAGTNHTIIVTAVGKIYAFGENEHGQLGNGNSGSGVKSTIPTLVANNTTYGFTNNGVDSNKVVSISGGMWHTVFSTASGRVYTSGSNGNGQLGNSNFGYDSNVPVLVSSNTSDGFSNNGTDKVIAVKAGSSHTVILTTSGKVYTFGWNLYGQLGTGSETSAENVSAPVRINSNPAIGFINDGVGDNKVVEIALGTYHTIIQTVSGKAYAFGRNDNGQLGNGDMGSGKKSYIAILLANNTSENFKNDGVGDNKIVKIAAGGWHSGIITTAKKTYGFGYNKYGQLGTGSQTDASTISRGGITLDFSLLGKAIEHNTDLSYKMKYSGNVMIQDILAGSTIDISIDNGKNYINIMENLTNGEYSIGNTGELIIKDNEEKEVIVRVTRVIESLSQKTEYRFIIDKKPPTIKEIVEEGKLSVCNIVDATEYYCNKTVAFQEVDISGIYSAKKVVEKVEMDIIDDIRNALINVLEKEDLEKEKVIYTFVDGAGNQSILSITMDNSIPNATLK